jgi:ankyrin repeat protein
MVAARSGYPRVVAPLLAGGADPDARATRGQTALMWAVAEQHPDVVEILLEGGADIHARSEVWELVMAVPPHGYRDYNRAIPHGGNTALMFAAQVGDLDSARLLVAAGADVDDSDAWGVSALAMAGHSGFRDLALFLLANGADPDAAGPGFTAMHTAIMRRDAPLAAALLERGADPNLPVGTWTPTRRTSDDFHFSPELVGATPYWLAARFGEPRLMELLLAHGADPRIVHRGEYVLESITGDGLASRANTTTALMAALEMGRGSAWVAPDRGSAEARTMAAVRIALEAGVDVNVEDTDGRRALDAAMRLAYDGLPGLLAEHGALAGETASAAPRSPRP